MRRALLGWYDRAARDLPWRRTRDPYAIWVSEAMLQQTTVDTVVPYYERFLSRYPDAASLALADEDALLAVWSGLGYYRRARLLKAGAGRIVVEHGGRVPSRLEEIRALPGVGRYTAGAIASIAFGVMTPVVDGNVVRVLSRLFAIPPNPRSSETAAREEIWRLADGLVPAPRPGDWNQALMELGATVCRPARPACGACPVARDCAALAEGDPTRYPSPKKRPDVVRASAALVVIERGGRILLVRRPGTEILGGLWELPGTLATVLRRTAGPRHATSDTKPRKAVTVKARALPPHEGRSTRPSDAMSVSEQPSREERPGKIPIAAGGRASQADTVRKGRGLPSMRTDAGATPARPSRREPANLLASERPENPGFHFASIARELGFEPAHPVLAGTLRHAVTHRNLTIEAWSAASPRALPEHLRRERSETHMWIAPKEIGAIPIGAASRKVVRKVLSTHGPSDAAGGATPGSARIAGEAARRCRPAGSRAKEGAHCDGTGSIAPARGPIRPRNPAEAEHTAGRGAKR
jgi:A/G-specific adenine glycosylase